MNLQIFNFKNFLFSIAYYIFKLLFHSSILYFSFIILNLNIPNIDLSYFLTLKFYTLIFTIYSLLFFNGSIPNMFYINYTIYSNTLLNEFNSNSDDDIFIHKYVNIIIFFKDIIESLTILIIPLILKLIYL